MSSSAPVRAVKKAVKGVTKAATKVVKKVAKPVQKVVEEVVDVVEEVAPVAAPLAMVAFPGVGTALGSALGASGLNATLLGGGLIGSGAAAIGNKNPLTGGLLGAGGAYLGSTFGGASGLLGGGSGGVPYAGAQYSVAPGSFQAALPGLGVKTAATTAPFTAIPGSFQAALPGLLAGSSGLSATNLLNTLRLGSSLQGMRLSPIPQQQQLPVQSAAQQAAALSGQANFDPTISLLTGYGAA